MGPQPLLIAILYVGGGFGAGRFFASVKKSQRLGARTWLDGDGNGCPVHGSCRCDEVGHTVSSF